MVVKNLKTKRKRKLSEQKTKKFAHVVFICAKKSVFWYINMKTYLITFSNLENDLVNRIKEYGNWAKINSNTFCIKVENMTVAQIRDNLSPYCSDFFIVIEITDSAWASFRLNKEVASWLK